MHTTKTYTLCMDWGHIGSDFLAVNTEKETWLKCHKINTLVAQKKVTIFLTLNNSQRFFSRVFIKRILYDLISNV